MKVGSALILWGRLVLKNGILRKSVSLAFALISLIALALFNEVIAAFAEERGWNQFFISGWQILNDLGLSDMVAFCFFAFGGATIALWIEFWIREKREAAVKADRSAIHCKADFTFKQSKEGDLDVSLGLRSENVSYWAWIVNNGGTMRNESVMLFVEFERQIEVPEVYAHADDPEGEWQQFASTDRFMFVRLKGWPKNDVSLLAIDSQSLGLDRRSELNAWRKYGPMDTKTQRAE